MAEDVNKQIELRFDETNRKFITSTTVNILNDPQLNDLKKQHESQRYELFKRYEQLLPNKVSSPIRPQSTCSSASSLILNNTMEDDISEDLRLLIEQRVPDLSMLDGEPMEFINGTKFYSTINDILTSDGEFWVEREFSSENQRKFRQFIDILSLFATSYESLKEVYIGQLVALHYETSWHRALVVSKSEEVTITKQPNARVRLVDYGSSLYVNVSQLKWLPEQFYLFPFKAVECVFSEAVKPTFSDTVRLTFKQLVLHKRLRATVYGKDGTRICVLLKCETDEGIVNVYRYLRAHEHKSKHGRMLDDGDIVQCLHNTIFNNSNSFDQSLISNNSMNLTIPILSPPSIVKLTSDQMEIKREEIKKIYKEFYDDNNNSIDSSESDGHLSIHVVTDNKKVPSPSSSSTLITPLTRLSFTQP